MDVPGGDEPGERRPHLAVAEQRLHPLAVRLGDSSAVPRRRPGRRSARPFLAIASRPAGLGRRHLGGQLLPAGGGRLELLPHLVQRLLVDAPSACTSPSVRLQLGLPAGEVGLHPGEPRFRFVHPGGSGVHLARRPPAPPAGPAPPRPPRSATAAAFWSASRSSSGMSISASTSPAATGSPRSLFSDFDVPRQLGHQRRHLEWLDAARLLDRPLEGRLSSGWRP